MGVSGLDTLRERLLAHGRAANTPAALIENGSRGEQRVIHCDLDSLPEIARREAVKSPTLLILGEVAALRLMLKNGEGIPANAERAIYWLEHAASQNHAEGAYQLGALYVRGDAGPAKARRALYMAQIAQRQNHPAAQALIEEFQQQRAAEDARRP